MTLRLIIIYISSIFIILLSFITVIYEVSHEDDLDRIEHMFPSMHTMRYKINKIEIRYPDTTLIVQRNEENRWILPSSDNFPADTPMIERLYQDIEHIELIAHKTELKENFSHIHLVNPDETQALDGEGVRFTLYADGNKPYIDFIVGDQLKSYISQSNVRLFTRFASIGHAFLAQAKSNFQYTPADFLTSQFGMPRPEEIISIELKKNQTTLLNIKRLINDETPEKIAFVPDKVAKGKKLVYPDVVSDYVLALTNKLKPVNATYLPPTRPEPNAVMTIELTKGRLAKINFWHLSNHYMMRIIRDDIETPHFYYIFDIPQIDYESLIQPIDKFLVAG